MVEVAAMVSLQWFHNRHVVYSVQEVVEEAVAKGHSQIIFSCSGVFSNILNEESES